MNVLKNTPFIITVVGMLLFIPIAGVITLLVQQNLVEEEKRSTANRNAFAINSENTRRLWSPLKQLTTNKPI